MTVQRIMGIETEYGVLRPGDQRTTPMVLSGLVVRAYANDVGLNAAQSRWDYSDESPLRDQRGYDIAREVAHESQLTDDIDPSFANVVLKNGARLYVDHAHPEYSSPEVTTPRDAVAYDRAGEVIMRRTAALLADDEDGPTQLYKNNTDGQGASYGTHENYLLRRDVPWARVVAGMTPFFVARQVVTGSGRVGIGTESERAGFQLTQRADFFEAEVGLETTLKRPIINTRDEPLADSGSYRRMHVIVGDTNVAEPTTALKVGMTWMLLDAVEDGLRIEDLALADPMRAIRQINADLSGAAPIELASGARTTPVALQREIRSRVLGALGPDSLDEAHLYVADLWGRGLDAIESGDWSGVEAELDIAIKRRLLDSYTARTGADYADPRVARLELGYHDITAQGLRDRMEAAGLMKRLTSPGGASRALTAPPATTRARLRGAIIAAAEDARADVTVDWVHVRLDDQSSGPLSLQDPLSSSDPRVDALVSRIGASAPVLPA